MKATLKVGWCPGALRPMASGDGLLVRIKPRGGTLTLAQGEGIAALASQCGNGQLELTGRANLHLRGVMAERLDRLQDGLGDLGLLDGDLEAEAVRNLVVSPLAGLDPAVVDIRPHVAAIERHLASDPACRALPAKWSIVIDDGGSLSLGDVAADLRLRFLSDAMLALDIGGCVATGSTERLLDILSEVARRVGQHASPHARDLVAELGPGRVAAALGILAGGPSDVRPPVTVADLPGHHRPSPAFFGVAAAFGALQSHDLHDLAQAAARAGTVELRLTPWRMVLVPLPKGADASHLEALGGSAFITHPHDPRLRVVACPGAPACHRGTTPTRADAASLAAGLGAGQGLMIHVSGCAKGCARPAPTPWTLVGHDGRYDVVRNGTAQDRPAVEGLSFAAASAWVRGSLTTGVP